MNVRQVHVRINFYRLMHTIRRIFFFALYLHICFTHSLFAGNIDLFVDVCRFQRKFNTGNYISVSLSANTETLVWKPTASNQFKASLHFSLKLMLISGGDTLNINDKEIDIETKPVVDTLNVGKQNWLQHIENYPIVPENERPPGRYLIRAEVVDNYGSKFNPQVVWRDIIVGLPSERGFAFSDIQFIKKWDRSAEGEKTVFSKPSGSFPFDIIPWPTKDLFINQDTLSYYLELYNTSTVITPGGEEDDYEFIVRLSIVQREKRLKGYTKEIKHKRASSRNYHTSYIDISNLESKTYFLIVELVNRDNNVLSAFSRKFHVINQRVDPEFDRYVARRDFYGTFDKYSESQLDYYLETLKYLGSSQEIGFIDALKNQSIDSYEMKKNFLYSFWSKRAREGKSVSDLWKRHTASLDYANQKYSKGHLEGWKTDRGRVLIKYGIPDQYEGISEDTEEQKFRIWKYDRLDAQINVEFVFVERSSTEGDYILVHSTKYEEISNPDWRTKLLSTQQ